MLFAFGVDPTSMFRSEGEVTAMQCNFHRLQMLVFDGYTNEKRLSRHHCCLWTRQMVSGRLVLETARLRVTALSNIRFKGKNK
jgi:hypothetical protein